MVNARQKGRIGEELVQKFLSSNTLHNFEMTPGSGSGILKGDLHIPGKKNRFCIEVKNYKESPISDKLLTSKSNDFVKWWTKLKSDCRGTKEPLLIFKYNRSKLLVATATMPENVKNYIDFRALSCYIMLAEDWIKLERIEWVT